MLTQIRWLLKEQSDLGPHCLPVCKNRFEKFARIFSRQHKQTTFSDAGFLGVFRVKTSACLVKFSVDDLKENILTLKSFFYFFLQKTEFDISCKVSPMEAICMKCQFCFLGKIRKTIKFFEYCEVIICCINPESGKGQHKQTKLVLAAFSHGPQHLEYGANIDQPGAGIM